MLEFLGEYEVTLDAKGRFLLPADIKKDLTGETAHQFVINKGMDPCLVLWPKQTWDPVYSRLNSMSDFDVKVRRFKQLFLDGISKVDLDSAGRLLLPKQLIEDRKLEKDLLLKAHGDKIEIWDKAIHRKFIESISGTTDIYSDLAQTVMVDKKEQ